MIAIIDYGAGNLRSVVNAIMKLGYQPNITSNPAEVMKAETVILPGVGAAGSTVESLKRLGLTLKEGEQHKARFIGTGMHGGVIYIRGDIDDHQLGKEVDRAELDDEDNKLLEQLVARYADYFNLKTEEIMNRGFIKLFPRWLRPYGQLYAY